MKRSQLRRSGPLRTKELSEFEKEFREVRPLVRERSGGRCEIRIPSVCDGAAHHVHHRRTRKRGGDNSMENLLDTCVACHGYLHDHPLWSEELGFLLPSAW